MTEEKCALVFENELSALKDSRKRGMNVFLANNGEQTLWVIATTEHQAKMALIDRIWPLVKQSKRDREQRFTILLEQAVDTMLASESEQGAE